jgi:hypothetical protein
MPIIMRGQKRVEKTWQQVVQDQFRERKVLPLISNAVGNDLVLRGHKQLIEEYAAYLDYHLDDKDNLPIITQYASLMHEVPVGEAAIRSDYLNFIKSQLWTIAEEEGSPKELLEEMKKQFDDMNFSQLSKNLGYPKFSEVHKDPWLILASFDLPIYLTTSYHTFMEAALEQAGKHPHTDFCRWHNLLDALPGLSDRYVPSEKEPLVYHLYGLDKYPQSLVLIEDHYMQFLVAISKDEDLIPPRVRHAFADSSIMLLGYDLSSWDFRSLFWSLIQPRPRRQQSVCVLQLDRHDEEEVKYLQKYLKVVDFEVVWESVSQYMGKLYQSLRA